MLTGNKGEWAELYAFLKILSEIKLPSADENLNIEPERFFEFLSLIWNDTKNGTLVYKLDEKNIEILNAEDVLQKTVPTTQVSTRLASIFKAIATGSGRSFSVPEAEKLMHSLMRTSLKASSSKIADIFGTLVDRSTNTAELSGFSVKSMLKNKATLLNHSGHTVFRYELLGFPLGHSEEIAAINKDNSKSYYMDRTARILELGGQFVFHSVISPQFEQNLRKIDTLLPEFVAEMLIGFFSRKGRSIEELIEYLVHSTAIEQKYHFTLHKEDYEFKMKQLLAARALGMQPSKPWDGMMRANGGYLVVVKTGDVLCYHAFNRDVFLNYLFNNTAFESPGGRQAPFLEIIEKDGKVFTDLKLQIRFTK